MSSFFLSKKEYLIISCGLLIAGLIFAGVNFAMGDKLKFDKNDQSTMRRLNVFDGDFIIGNHNAPVNVIFYGDFACVHCKRFVQDHYERLKRDYIDKGIVRFVFRPVVKHQKTLAGAKFLFCDRRNDVENSEIFYNLFKENWYLNSDHLNALMKLVVDKNYSTKEHFVECISSKELTEKLYKINTETIEKLNINSTPQVFVNKKLVDANSSMFYIIEKELSGMKNSN